ncbi:hypothetical protein [Jiella avicenniae]|uniref:Uncharacterized protein n=1 Tax=Jiella avicenniae TaxID=2907202 RepID=A0A9X1T4T4_9HYPH|nr:hypothetical protein [Jiella avicenniae]MCE7027565.1 hypothetical protein [Jiella avicenniae]
MSLTIGSSTTTTSVLSSDDTNSGVDDVAAIKDKLASAQTALSEAEEAGDTEEATTQQALVTKYTAELAKAQKAAESGGAGVVQASGPAIAESGEANPYRATARIDVTTLAASAETDRADGTSDAAASATAEAERAEAEYKANMPLAADKAETAEA